MEKELLLKDTAVELTVQPPDQSGLRYLRGDVRDTRDTRTAQRGRIYSRECGKSLRGLRDTTFLAITYRQNTRAQSCGCTVLSNLLISPYSHSTESPEFPVMVEHTHTHTHARELSHWGDMWQSVKGGTLWAGRPAAPGGRPQGPPWLAHASRFHLLHWEGSCCARNGTFVRPMTCPTCFLQWKEARKQTQRNPVLGDEPPSPCPCKGNSGSHLWSHESKCEHSSKGKLIQKRWKRKSYWDCAVITEWHMCIWNMEKNKRKMMWKWPVHPQNRLYQGPLKMIYF